MRHGDRLDGNLSAGRQDPVDGLKVDGPVLVAHRLDHLHGDNRVVLAFHGAVVLQPHRHHVRVSGGRDAFLGQRLLLAADGHAHFGVLGFHSQLGEQPQQRGVGPLVVDDEPGVHPEGRAVRLRDVVGVCVAAQPGIRLEKRDVVLPFKDIRCGESGYAAADDGHASSGFSRCWVR